MTEYLEAKAEISTCGLYRYELTRRWVEDAKEVVYVMLNPSTADGDQDDPTIRKCVGFAHRWGFGAIKVVNLFAFRATQPKDMLAAEDPVGVANTVHLVKAFTQASMVVCAWGGTAQPLVAQRSQEVVSLITQLHLPKDKFWCLGYTKLGNPRHPLMLSYTTQPTPFFKGDTDAG